MGTAEFFADFSLARRASARDVAAQRELVQRLLPRVRSVCQALLRDSTNARDASQTAMLELLCSTQSYRGECSLEHWADRVISRTALRWIARERRSAHIPLADTLLREGEITPAATFLRECLDVLPEAQATALVLRICFEYTVDEISELTQVSRNTVKDRLVRARQTLRGLLRSSTSAASFDGFAEVATPLVSPRRDGRALGRAADEPESANSPRRRSRP